MVYKVYLVLFHPAAFYFPSPYHEPGAVLFNALAYLPKVGWAGYVPLCWLAVKTYRKPGFYLWVIQALVYSITMAALVYWGM